MPANSKSRRSGLMCAFFSITCSAPDAMLLRFLQHTGASNMVILSWKTLLVACIQLAFGAWQHGGETMVAQARDSWQWMLCGAMSLCLAWLATVANLTTTSASALALFYIAPLWAVPMGFFMNADQLQRRTVLAMLVAAVGIVFIFVPSLSGGGRGSARPSFGSVYGDCCGLVSGVAFAAYLTCCRHASLHRPKAPLAVCAALGTLAVSVPAAAVSIYQGDALLDVSPLFCGILLVDCAAVAAYNLGTGLASRHLASAELGLYLTLDVVFAPSLVWLIHGEVPPMGVIIGGGLLMASVLTHEALGLALLVPAPDKMPLLAASPAEQAEKELA